MSSTAEPQDRHAEPDTRRAPTAMIVEDEAIIALSLEDGLGDEGFEIAGPFSACADALAWLERASPDVAVLDAVLSDGPCLDLARALQRRGVPFMIYSGVEAFEEHAPELDGVLWLEKPTAVEQVVNAVLGLTRPAR